MTRRRSSAGRLADRLRSHLGESGLIQPEQRLLVGVSGGLDSMVLLHLLRFPLRDLGLRLSVAHLDHAMRPGSPADAQWVRGVCTAWDVPCHHRRLDPPARSEADARERRYAFFDAVADERETGIATAHHRDDQAETLLFRAIRGTGLRGLRGIAPRRGRLIRPLLPFRRAELRDYAKAVGLRYREDPTNRELAYARNLIRHQIMPALESARPGAAESLARLADRARAAELAWEAVLERVEEEVVLRGGPRGLVLARPVLHSYHPALRARVLRHLLRRYGSTPDRAGTRAALEFISSGPSGGELHVAGGVHLERDFDEIRIVATTGEAAADRELVVSGPAPGAGRARIGERWIDVAWGEAPGGAGYRPATIPDPTFPLTIRGWRPGDRIRFGYGSKKLKDLFREHRLDRYARRSVPVVEDGAGRVVWVVGIARAEGVGENGTGFQIAVRDAGKY